MNLPINKKRVENFPINEENVKSIRPGFGIHPKYLKSIVGKKFNKDYHKGDRLNFDMIE